jgi:O-antigen ligase
MQLKNPLNLENNQRQVGLFLLAAALLSLAIQVRFVNTISVMALVAVSLFHKNGLRNLKSALVNPYFIACLLFVLMQVLGLTYTANTEETMRKFSVKTGMVAIPFFFCAGYTITLKERKWLFYIFNIALSVVALICLLLAVVDYNNIHDKSVFFYHRLVRPFSHHAIYFSFYLLFCIIFWIERGFSFEEKGWPRNSIVFFIAFDVIMILLLSSKVVITIIVIYFLYVFAKQFIKKKNILVIGGGSVILAFTLFLVFSSNNPVKKRFSEITQGGLDLLTQEKFSPDMYFNGLQLRMLNWRFTYEILNEEKAWLLGVGPGDALQKLNEKYVSMNMYKGEGDTDRGYLSYNCHNQFLETVLQSGTLGLLLLAGAFVSLCLWIGRVGSTEAYIILLSILAFSFTESLLETQYGIFLFSFFPLLALWTENTSKFNTSFP